MLNRAIISMMPYVPRSLVWHFSRRYIAGTSLDDALNLVASLNDKGMCATLDLLGEDCLDPGPAVEARDIYLDAIEGISDRKLDCNISIKLSQMALRFDRELCEQIVSDLVDAADRADNFVRIDMEDSSVTDSTLDIYRANRDRKLGRVGAVIQACLHRSDADVAKLITEADRTHLRLCKGIYVEPAEIAYQDREEVRDSYKNILRRMLRGGVQVGIATHDPPLVEDALKAIKELGVEKTQYEFQMLLGVAEGLRDELVAAGHRLRVYVPFGEAWFAYSHRRLRENPQIAKHVIRNLFRKR